MSKEDRELLEAVRNYPVPKELHPIAMYAFKLYEDAGFKFPSEALAEIKGLLDGYDGEIEELGKAIYGLTHFVMLLNEQYKDEVTAKRISELMQSYTHLFEPFWQQVGEAMQNVGEDTKSLFNDMTGTDTTAEKKAPTYGAAAPKNTVSLKDIMPPPRPPPWAPKK